MGYFESGEVEFLDLLVLIRALCKVGSVGCERSRGSMTDIVPSWSADGVSFEGGFEKKGKATNLQQGDFKVSPYVP